MSRILFSISVFILLLAACGSPKTGTEVSAPFDEAAAKQKFGDDYSQEELQQLFQAEAMKQSSDQLTAESEALLTSQENDQVAENARSFNEKKRIAAKSEKLREQANLKKIQSSQNYATANKTSFSLSQQALQRSIKPNAEQHIVAAADEAQEAAKTHFNLAAKKRQEAEAEADLAKKAQILAEATELEFMAVDEMQHAHKIHKGLIPIEKPQTTAQQPQQQAQSQTSSRGLSNEIAYKVQIAASNVELPIEHIRQIYKTRPGEIINNELEDNWYKYSVGMFETYAEAQAYKDEIGVQGAFIIAYRADEKIILPEIQEKIARGEMTEPPKNIASPNTQSEIIYKVQIAATRIPARPSQLAEMYHGKQIVSINKVGGRYKYTLGNFDTIEKAEAFRTETGVEKAFIVAFDKNGNDVPIKKAE